MSSLWISALPAIYAGYLAPLCLITIGYLVERNFVGRMAIFGNAIALNLHVLTAQNPSFLFVWYANIGLLMGIIAIISYAVRKPLNGLFYTVGWLYCSIVVGFIIVLF